MYVDDGQIGRRMFGRAGGQTGIHVGIVVHAVLSVFTGAGLAVPGHSLSADLGQSLNFQKLSFPACETRLTSLA